MAIETARPVEITADARPAIAPAHSSQHVLDRVRVDGKHFKAGGSRFAFRGVTYGTFVDRPDGSLFPEPRQVRSDLRAIADAGFTVLRTYTPPPPDLLDTAGELGLRVLAGLNYEDWRYIVGRRVGDNGSIRRAAREAAAEFARSVAGNPVVLGICIGNEVPADVIRWVGTRPVRSLLSELSELIHDIDPE